MKIISKYNIEKILVEGHCDSIGSKQYNYKLSEKRAKEVRKLLTQNSIQPGIIKTCIGYGKDQPILSNISESERQQNRRVVVHFYTTEGTKKNIQVIKKDETITKKEMVKQEDELDIKDFKAGKKIILKNLLFYGGRHILKPESIPVLDNLCAILKQHTTLKIEIHGHVCCTSFQPDGHDFDTNTDNLSINRAKMIYRYLIEECGIDQDRLSYRGFGGSQKIIERDFTEAEQQINRRVEIKVTEE